LSLGPDPTTATSVALLTSPGVQTFSPVSSQVTWVTFRNTTGAPAEGLTLSISVPKQWTSFVPGSTRTSVTIPYPVAPGARVSTTFKVTSGPAAFNGDLVANAVWTSGGTQSTAAIAEKVRNVSPIKLNEFRISTASPANPTNSFIELYNAGASNVDISNWTLTEHPTQQAIFSTVKFPAGTKLAAGGFYLLGLSNSGLAVPAHAGDTTINVRSTTGLTVGDAIGIDTGSNVETRKIASIGTAAGNNTTLWQPLPDGPVITIPAGSTNVPVTSVSGFAVGEKIAIGYGGAYPTVAGTTESYEVATVTAVGKQGTQAYLGAEAPAGSTNIKVTSVANISAGDTIRLDIDSAGHGIETVTVTRVGTQTSRTALTVNASAGATNIKIRNMNGLAVGDKMIVGIPGETVTVTAIGAPGPAGGGVDFTPAFAQEHPNGDGVLAPGTGLDLAAPLRFNHAANLPFSDRGTGISFKPATAFAHLSNEPVQTLGSGITLDSPMAHDHSVNTVVHDATVTTAGYQGTPEPNQWFGGPALSPSAGNMVLRDATGLVVDSLNYGLLVDPWAAEGYQAVSGSGQSGCHVTTPGPANRSAGRFPDGADTDSNCADFLSQAAATLAAASAPGATNIKVASVEGFEAGQKIMVDTGAIQETAVIAAVGTAGATTMDTSTGVGATVIPVASAIGFSPGQTISIDSGANAETAVVVSAARRGAMTIAVSAPLRFTHPAGAPVAGTGITLANALTQAHASGAQIADNVPTPGAPNQYYKKPH